MDTAILLWIQENLHNPFTDWFFPAVTFLGDKGLIWLVIAVLLLISRKYRKWGVTMLCAMLLTAVAGELLLKEVFERLRPFHHFPELELLIEAPSSFSFPSGHTASSFAAAVVLLKCRRSFGIPALILASCIAFSRLFLFVHYPSDVLCGAILGVLMALLTCFLFRKFWNLQSPSRLRR